MALSGTATPPARQVTAWHFVRLKLRITAGGLRGRSSRVALLVVGAMFAVVFAALGFLVFSAPGLLGSARDTGTVTALGGAGLILGWLFLPLVFFGIDESLDPARFALLPLPRRTLITGLFTASLVGVPAAATLIATTGMTYSAALLGGPGAGVAALGGTLLGVLLCVALSRAVTSGFATALRSRRARDLATITLAGLVALIGPVQLLATAGARNADWARLAGPARVVGWTPAGAPWTLGQEIVEGRYWAVPVKILITVAAIGALLWWWSRSLESAMLGAAGSARTRETSAPTRSPVEQLFGRTMSWLPHNRFGALVAREVRYWWRETRRRASLITFSVVGVALPVMTNLSGDTSTGELGDIALQVAAGILLFVGVLAALGLANQFGFDGSAYAANIVAAVPGRVELHARVLGYSTYLGPLLAVIAVVVGVVVGRPDGIPALVGTLIAAYGTGLAVVLPVSVLAAYALPDTSNPFAVSSGAGLTKGLLSFAALLAAGIATVPVLVAAFLMGSAWVWVGLPLGVVYGVAAYLGGVWVTGAVLDRRMPELLAAVTPNR